MGDHRDGVRRALENFYKRKADEHAKEQAGPTRRNEKPEKKVEHECVLWFRKNNWSGQVYESKAKKINGRWVASGMKFGTCDWQGNTDQGIAAYVEFKAPGKRAAFNAPKNHRQKSYLLEKINGNAFACVTDSATLLEQTYRAWLSLRLVNLDEAKLYLLNALPKQKSP